MEPMTGPEEFAEENGAEYVERAGWGHVEGSILVHCTQGLCSQPAAPHGRFTSWTVRSEWALQD